MPPTPPALDLALIALIRQSHQRLLGEDLLDPGLSDEQAAQWLYSEAPFCLLAHDASADPRFIFANRAVQKCFGYDWGQFIGMPSRLSADTPEREERQALLSAVARDGYATGYRGLRIAADGRRFWIENVTVWNLLDEAGHKLGQAATYRSWRPA